MTYSSLASNFIKERLKREKELENKIMKLEKELENERSLSSGDNPENEEYYLYKDIINKIIPNLVFEYEGGSSLSTDDGYYSINLSSSVPLTREETEVLIARIKNYKNNNDLL